MTRRKKHRSWWNIPGHCWDKARDPDGRMQLGFYFALLLIAFAVGGIVDRTLFSPDEITPENARFGWNEAVAKQEAPRIAQSMPKFQITDDDGKVVTGAGKNAELWKFAKLANGGKHIATWKQESGDCVSMGWSNAIAYRMAFQIAKEQRNEVLKIPFPPYMYGVSRVLVGKRQLGRGQGSVGAWAAQGSQGYGVLPSDHADALGFRYSGRLADQWGWTGPPKETITYGSKFRIRSVAQVRSWEDVRDALVHGYPVTVASNVGFDGGSYDRDGKRWLRPRGNWGHQMCFVGVEDRQGRDKGADCLNSWGPDAHAKPLNDEPPGSFWVDWQTVQRMVSQGDSWAYSDFDGFPAADDAGADWNAFKLAAVEQTEVEQIARVEQPETPQAVLLETRKMVPLDFLVPVLCVGLVLLSGLLYAKYGNRSRSVGTMLVLLAIIGITVRADAGHRRKMARQMNYHAAPVQVAAANSCTCPSGACCGGNCTNCPANACANGRCPTGYKPAAGKKADPAAGLSPDQKPDPKATQAESHTASDFAAFGAEAKPEAELPNVWTSFPMARQLRTYADCFEHEAEFVLVIGSETEALQAMEVSDKPVAHETAHAQISHGTWHVFDKDGHKLIEPIEKQFARHVGAVQVRR